MSLPDGLISKKEARKCQKRYMKKKHKHLCDKNGFEDEFQFTFPLERVKEYIAYIEADAAKEGYTNLGLKICLGTYKKGKDDKGPKNTIFLVPTANNCSKKENNKKAKYDSDEDSSNDEENDNVYTARAMNFTGSGGTSIY